MDSVSFDNLILFDYFIFLSQLFATLLLSVLFTLHIAY
jgi:hypothetical protein